MWKVAKGVICLGYLTCLSVVLAGGCTLPGARLRAAPDPGNGRHYGPEHLVLWASFLEEGVRWGHICTSTHPEHPGEIQDASLSFSIHSFYNMSGWIRVLNGTPREALNIESQPQGQGPHGWEESMGGSRVPTC